MIWYMLKRSTDSDWAKLNLSLIYLRFEFPKFELLARNHFYLQGPPVRIQSCIHPHLRKLNCDQSPGAEESRRASCRSALSAIQAPQLNHVSWFTASNKLSMSRVPNINWILKELCHEPRNPYQRFRKTTPNIPNSKPFTAQGRERRMCTGTPVKLSNLKPPPHSTTNGLGCSDRKVNRREGSVGDLHYKGSDWSRCESLGQLAWFHSM